MSTQIPLKGRLVLIGAGKMGGAMAANAHVSAAQSALAGALLSAIGEVVTVEREELIDAATALSGSGPAYVFLLTECMAAAGQRLGLPAEVATKLARATVAGAGELMRQSGLPAATLRENVTSPKGTTYAHGGERNAAALRRRTRRRRSPRPRTGLLSAVAAPAELWHR